MPLPINFCQDALNLLYVLMEGEQFAYTEEDKVFEDDEWRIRVHWFPANEHYPEGHHMRPAMVEVYARSKTTGKTAYIYKSDTGNDNHPEFGASGWRFHMV
jgi:hypothetical protein